MSNVLPDAPAERTLLDQLGFLIGRFGGPELMHETAWAPAGRAHGRADGRLTALALIQEQVQSREGAPDFEALNIFTLDAATGDVFLYSFDSVGYLPDPRARGSWIGGELVLVRSTARGHSRTRYAEVPDGYRWMKEFRPTEDAEWSTVVEGELTRIGAGVPAPLPQP
ncbi:hypothetical protein [Leifsonia sp. NPDC058230]|uniref:hypothetical protein n=1 Tax=Leifsonia sp. NPDC058230 TaxID=3346391 RepID=UPI0036DDB8E8